MSRIGKLPIDLPKGVKVSFEGKQFIVEGPKGKLIQDYQPGITFKQENNKITVTRQNETKRLRSLHGLYRNLLNNMVIGVSTGFSKTLLINGVGYRAEVKGKSLILNLGYSNPIEYPIPDEFQVNLESNTKIIISCIDKQRLGQVCAEIRSLRPPEPYKGKGVKYETEIIRRKIGKAGVK